MATPVTALEGTAPTVRGDLEDELRQAERDFETGAYIEVTVEELDRCIAAGTWPWPEESSA